MKAKFYLLIIAILVQATSMAQTPERMRELADRYFDEYSYDRAISFYEEIGDKSTDIKRNLALSYLRMNNTNKAEEYLFDIVNSEETLPEDLFNYSQVLAMNKKYPESVKWMTVYHEQKSTDTRSIKTVEQPEYYEEIQAEDAKFEIANLDINSPDEDFGATFYKDKVVFASSRTGVETVVRRWNWNQLAFLDMYVADRDSSFALTHPKRHHKKFNKKFHEGPASFNGAGDVMVYTSNNYKRRSSKGEVNLELYETKFNGEKWSKPEALPWNDKEYSVGHASLTEDGNTMYFVSDMPGGYGGADIYKAYRNGDGTWGEAQRLDVQINTEGNEMFPFIQKDSVLFFASDGHLGAGGLDIFYIDFRDNGVYRAKNIKLPVNSSKDDFAFIMNNDRTKGYFSSNREGGKGDDDIYSFTLPSPMKFNKMLLGKITDQLGNELDNATIRLKIDGEVVEEYTTGENGEYVFEVSPDGNYDVVGSKDSYSVGANRVNLEEEEFEVVYSDLMLNLSPKHVKHSHNEIDVYAGNIQYKDAGLIVEKYDAEPIGLSVLTAVANITNGEPISDAKITIVDKQTGESMVVYTPKEGEFLQSFDPDKKFEQRDYAITIERDGFKKLDYDYSPKLSPKGQYKSLAYMIPEDMPNDLVMKDVFDINPIYFDLDKYDIRPDAAQELDRIVEIMNKMPNLEIELSSHTDCRSSRKYNKRLSNNRAVSTADYIKARISNPSRIYGEGKGEIQLVNDCECEGINYSSCPEDQHQQNRRTEFRIVKL